MSGSRVLFRFVGNSKDAKLISFRTAFYFAGLDLDPKSPLNDPSEKTGQYSSRRSFR